MNDRIHPYELESRIQGLQDTEANYWAVMDDPEATETDRVEAAELLDEAETRIRELTAAPIAAETAANLLGHDVSDAKDGTFLGPVEKVKPFEHEGYEACDLLMVRLIHGDGTLRPFELHEVREHMTEGRVAADPSLDIREPRPEGIEIDF